MTTQPCCSACGNPILPSARFCSLCGQPIAASARSASLHTWALSAAVFFIGSVIGLSLPDLDLRVPVLLHRSILTHSFLASLLLIWLVSKYPHRFLHPFSMGVCGASAVHLCFDLFPARWSGFALIAVPFYGRANALQSWLWIALSIVICLYLAFTLLRTVGDVLLLSGGLLVTMVWSTPVGTQSFGFVLTTLIVTSILALVWAIGPLELLKMGRTRLHI
jgi:hypothetical protein